MRKIALTLALAIAVPAWGQDKAPEKPAGVQEAAPAQEAPKAEAAKTEAPKAEAKKPAHKHSSKRMEDARHCLDKSSNTEIIKCAEAYL